MTTHTVESEIVLGWSVTKGLDPEYWLRPAPQPGHPDQRPYLVTVSTPSIAHHTVIVAQSGSGKSFFLGRIIEEIITKSRSHMFVIDPNSDFRKISTVDDQVWEKAKKGYDTKKRSGYLPDEASSDDFKKKWDPVTKIIHTFRPAKEPAHKRLRVDWLGISMDLFSEGLPPASQNELRHCHEFVRSIANLILLTKSKEWAAANDILDAATQIFANSKGLSHAAVLSQIEAFFPVTDDLLANVPKNLSRIDLHKAGIFFTAVPLVLSKLWPTAFSKTVKGAISRRIQVLQKSAALARTYVLEDMERFYFSTAHILKTSGLLGEGSGKSSTLNDARLQVVDVPSIPNHLRLLAISALLETEWARARRNWELALESEAPDTRVPTFIVLDEAHNLVPAAPTNPAQKALLEQFRRIAAEGRKFGLFLVLVSQRPDKLDPLVISECENRGVMKIGTEAVLKITADTLGLGDVPLRTLSRCLEFDTGRALLIGPWAGERDKTVLLYGAARRTAEGGKNLDPDYWAQLETSTVSSGETVALSGGDGQLKKRKAKGATAKGAGNKARARAIS